MDKFKLIIITIVISIITIGCSKSVLTFNDELLVKSTVIDTNIVNGHEHSNYYKNGYNNYMIGEYAKAASDFERAIDVYDSDEEDFNELVDIQYFLARSYYFLGEHGASIDLSEQSIELNEQLDNRYVMNCMNVGENYYSLENHENALKYFTIAEDNYDKIVGNSYYEITDIFVAMLKSYQETGNVNKVLEYAQKIDDYDGLVVNQEKYNQNIMYAYDVMVTAYIEMGDYEKAIDVLTKAENLSIENQDYEYAVLLLYCKAELYFEMGNVEKGNSIIYEAIDLCNEQLKIDNNTQLADIKNTLEDKLVLGIN